MISGNRDQLEFRGLYFKEPNGMDSQFFGSVIQLAVFEDIRNRIR